MRSRQDERTLPVTARALETIIRLASAHAKARLSKEVEEEPDVSAAMDILAFALYHESNISTTKDQGKNGTVATVSESDSDIDDSDINSRLKPLSKKARVNDSTNSNTASIETVQQKIWEAVCAAGDAAEVSLMDICSDIDYDMKLEAVRSMENRVMEDDGMLYMV